MPGLEIETFKSGNDLVVALKGDLDLASAPALREALSEAAGQEPRRLVIDLAEVSFMDSTGLQAMLDARRRAQQASYELLLRRAGQQVQRVFELTNTDSLFEFER